MYKLAEGSLPAIGRHASTIPDSTSAGTLLPLLGLFDSLDLADFEGARLLDRVDTKYVLSVDDLADVLDAVSGEYGLLSIDGESMHAYENQYFDTFDRALFRAHHNKDLCRFKYRYRRYAGVDDVWFEVKHKTNKGRMSKSRVQVGRISRALTPSARREVEKIGVHDPDELVPTMYGTFRRISLRALETVERATIDVDLEFGMGRHGAATRHLAVIEVKQPRRDHQSPLVRALHDRGIRRTRFSKYCVGMLELDASLKHNAFKPLLRVVENIEAHGISTP